MMVGARNSLSFALYDLWCKQEVKLKAIFIIIIPLFHSTMAVGGGPFTQAAVPCQNLTTIMSKISCMRRQRRRKWHHQPKNALCTMRRWEEPSRTTSGAPKSIAEQQQGSDQLMHKKKNEEKRNVNFRSTAIAPEKCSYNTVATPLSHPI